MNDQGSGRMIVRYMRRPGRPKRSQEVELTCSRLLVDGDVVDFDLSIVVVGSVGDRIRAGPTAGVGGTGPVTADGDVDDNAVILEGAGDVTALAGPESYGDPPVTGIGVSTLDILRDLVSVKPPKRDLRVVPEHSENATATSVEWAASTPLEIAHGTTSVAAT